MPAQTAFYLLPQMHFLNGVQASDILGAVVKQYYDPKGDKKRASSDSAGTPAYDEYVITDCVAAATASKSP